MSFEHIKNPLSYKRSISRLKYELLNILSNTEELRDNIITTQNLVLTKDRKRLIVSFSSLFGNINKVARMLSSYSKTICRILYARVNLKGFPRLTFIPVSKS
ncbi:Ribosome-binding factor A [Candidatus Tremblaya phenacola]|uniref:Ribosome-binding factor A n=1 Tax=Candidatus Tremblayella phenacoccinincola TaxID=1010676 RepID=A0A2G0V704_9PROT|nr:Ribosome-binding factor A [Candidatus Tremblaya phenacola]